MKLHLTRAEGRNLITAYGPGWVQINEARYEKSLIVLPNQLIHPWEVANLDALAPENFEQVAALAPEVLLIGTGGTLRFPHPSILKPLVETGIGFEVMDTAAACRTFNILMAEGRHVAAALIV